MHWAGEVGRIFLFQNYSFFNKDSSGEHLLWFAYFVYLCINLWSVRNKNKTFVEIWLNVPFN